MCQTTRALEERMPQMPASNRGPLATEGLISRRLTGPEAKMALPKDEIFTTNIKTSVVIELAGHLIEFLTYSGATFLVLTQIIENLNNCRKICDGVSGDRATLYWDPCSVTSVVGFSLHCFLLCLIILFL